MKTVCKKLLSLMLVAVLLVSAVPMMASAAGDTCWIEIIEESADGTKTQKDALHDVSYTADTTTLAEALTASGYATGAEARFNRASYNTTANGKRTSISLDSKLPAGINGISVVYDAEPSTPEPSTPEPSTPESSTPEATPTVAPISITVKVDNSDNVVWTGSKVPANGKSSLVKDLLSYVWNSDWDNAYTFHHAWVSERQTNLGRNDKVYAGETLYIALENKTTSGNSGSGSGSGSDSGSSSKFPYSVYLHIYAKGNVGSPIKTVTLDTWTCVKDGVITLDEVKDVVKTYYTAKTSDGIGYDGFYYSTSTTKTDYIKDENKTERINNLDDLRTQGYVHLNVWIDNYVAKSSSSSNADSTNPKTGDSIYTAVAVMGLSVTALAAVYFINKKRIAY